MSNSPSPSVTTSASGTASATATSRPACVAGFFSPSGFEPCAPCSPGTYAFARGSQMCLLCPVGTYGISAGLTTSSCSGPCDSCTTPGMSAPPPATSLSCASTGARAAPPALGLLLWPAVHPQNPQKVDLIVAPQPQCAQLSPGGTCNIAAANSIAGADNVVRYVIGTAAALHLEAAEPLTCAQP